MATERLIHAIISDNVGPDLIGCVSSVVIKIAQTNSFVNDVKDYLKDHTLASGWYLCRDQGNATGVGLVFRISADGEFVPGFPKDEPTTDVVRWPPRKRP